MIENKLILGIDVGGTNIRTAFVDSHMTLTGFEIVKTRDIFVSDNPAVELVQYIRAYCQKYSKLGMPAAISIGFPSTINKERSKILSTPNIQGLNNIEITKIMMQALGRPVYIERDVNFLILSDMRCFGIEGQQTVIGCYIGTGLGNAICLQGEILIGKNGVAAELGHTPMMGYEDSCPCGNKGCIEMYASGKALHALKDRHFPDIAIKDIFTAHGNSPVIEKFIDTLAIPIATEINIFDPDTMILGGGVVQMNDFPKHTLISCIYQYTRKPFPAEALDIRFSLQDQKSGVTGAGIHGFQKLKKEGSTL